MSVVTKLAAQFRPNVGADEPVTGGLIPAEIAAEAEAEAKQCSQQDDAKKLTQAMGTLTAGAFEDQFGEFNIRVATGKRSEIVNIKSCAGEDAIRQVVQAATRKMPPKSQIENIQAMIRIAVRSGGKKGFVFQRIASIGCCRLIDLGDPEGHCVHITAGHWELRVDVTTAFLRGRGYGAHPLPIKSKSPMVAFRIVLNWLRGLGVSESRAALVVVALVAWLRTGNTYPILLLYGQAGSGKTVAARLILLLIDPTDSLSLPNIGLDVEHIAAAAQHRHILSFDNLSKLSAANQDTLCICATGGEIHNRKLYSNGDIAVLPIHRPVLMTAVQPVITRPDLLSRAIPIEFSQRETRKGEEEILAEFMVMRPVLLGALCDLLAAAEV